MSMISSGERFTTGYESSMHVATNEMQQLILEGTIAIAGLATVVTLTAIGVSQIHDAYTRMKKGDSTPPDQF